jgi:hypothetical protein
VPRHWLYKVGGLAEEAGRYPATLAEYGKVAVSWWTRAIRGLHRNDFSMAAKTATSQKCGHILRHTLALYLNAGNRRRLVIAALMNL